MWSGPVWRWDRSNEIYVDLPGATPMPASEADVLDGANAAAVLADNGEWEILQFAEAELVAAGRWRLTTLLRGQAGSEPAAMAGAETGAPFLLLDEAPAMRELAPDAIGRHRSWRFVPAGAALDSTAAAVRDWTPRGIAFRPLAPARLRGRRDHATGDWHLDWIRRTRRDGDSWDLPQVPLGEETEGYVLEILAPQGGAVLRSVALSEPRFVYTAAMQTADFGDPVWNVPLRVAQTSATVGPGTFAEALAWHFEEVPT